MVSMFNIQGSILVSGSLFLNLYSMQSVCSASTLEKTFSSMSSCLCGVVRTSGSLDERGKRFNSRMGNFLLKMLQNSSERVSIIIQRLQRSILMVRVVKPHFLLTQLIVGYNE